MPRSKAVAPQPDRSGSKRRLQEGAVDRRQYVYLKEEEKLKIQQAAHAERLSVSGWMAKVAVERAEEILERKGKKNLA